MCVFEYFQYNNANLMTVKEPRKLGDKFQGNDRQSNVSIILINTYNQN